MQHEHPTTQTCNKCSQEKPITEFYIRKDTGKPKRVCKECVKMRAATYRENNRETIRDKMRDYRAKNPDVWKETTRRYRETHRKELNERSKKDYRENLKERKAARKKYREENKEDTAKRNREWLEKNRDDPDYKRKKSEYYRKHYALNYAAYAEAATRRQEHIRQATPRWANKELMARFYTSARMLWDESGIEHHVDHIIPLRGKMVSGLHCEANLQVVTAEYNLRKRNHYG